MRVRGVGLLMAAVWLAGCGGGSSAPEPTRITLSANLSANGTANEIVAQGDEFIVRVQGQWTSTGAQPGPVFVQVRDSSESFEVPAATSSSGEFSVDLPVRGDAAAGVRDGQLELRACMDAACAQVYEGSGASLSYRFRLVAVDDWSMHQGGPGHRGHLPIRLDPERFHQVWTWVRPPSSEPIGGINAVATAQGKVLVTTDIYFGEAVIYALNETDGSEAWTRSLGPRPSFGPPSVTSNRVFAASAGHSDSLLWTVDLGTGEVLGQSAFSGQWPNVLAPTVMNGVAVIGAGYYGGELFAYSTRTGKQLWTQAVGGVWDMFAPAADRRNLYHHSGNALYVLDRTTGAEVARIADPLVTDSAGGSYHGGPLLGNKGLVIAYSGGAFSGRASSSTEHYGQRVLTAFDPVARRVVWSSAASYLTMPAVADGVIYVGNSSSLDALDEATGEVLWRFTPDPAVDGSSFHRNSVVTRTHLFASTDSSVLAIDLATRKVVWRYPKPGMLAISAGRTLYIGVGATQSSGELVAVRLK
jgi:outer membrane protein assembly factor BamB